MMDEEWFEMAHGIAKEYQLPAIIPTLDPDQRLQYPSYQQEIWKKPQVIYGHQEDGLTWEYSDRIWQWDRTKAEAASEKAKDSGASPKTARYAEAFLRAYFDNPNLKLMCVMGGCNLSNGYEYYVYGFKN